MKKALQWIAIVFLFGCNGVTEQAAWSTANEAGASAAGSPSEVLISTAGAGTLSAGGSSAEAGSAMTTAGAAGLAASAGSPTAGTGGKAAQGGSAGAPSSAGSGGTGTGGTSCSPKNWDQACANRGCGMVPDGCGAELACGSCPTGSECLGGVCAKSCASLGLECGPHPVLGLECGQCPAGQVCGAVSVGQCSTCVEINNDGVCPSAFSHLWTACGAAPAAECRKPFEQDPSWWCCP